MKTINEKINESFDSMEKTLDRVYSFIKDVEKMRILQRKYYDLLNFELMELENKVDEFIAKRNEG